MIPFSYEDPKFQFTPLPDTLHNTMVQLVEKKMISLPLVKPLDPNKPLLLSHKNNDYCHFHQKNGHDIKHFKRLKHLVQDLIDSSRLSIGGVNDQGNKYVAPPNQNFQIFMNPMPNHSISFVKSRKTKNIYMMNVDTNIEEMVGMVEIEPCKG
jgi:hypothetical protein